jgi:hypothetical protein
MHYTWEQLHPVPCTDSEDLEDMENDRITRHEENRELFEVKLHLAGPELQNIHRVEYDAPEECTIPCAGELPWNATDLPYMIFAADQVLAMGAGSAFDLYKQMLSVLTFQSAERRNTDFTWMLKCPFHMPYLKDLAAAFPGSTVVWTHRDPVECIASACSLYEAILGVTSEVGTVDKHKLGKAVMHYSLVTLARAEASIAGAVKEKGLRVLHVRYKETIGDPVSVCKRVCKEAGLEYSEEYIENLEAYIQESREKRANVAAARGGSMHRYSLEEYGLSESGVQQAFEKYVEQYDL